MGQRADINTTKAETIILKQPRKRDKMMVEIGEIRIKLKKESKYL